MTLPRTAIIIKRLRSGESLASIARDLKVSRQRVSQLVKDAGESARAIKAQALDGKITKRLREGGTEYRIAQEFGCSASRVASVRKALGLPPPERHRESPEVAARNKRVVRLLLTGKTYQAVADEVGITIGHVFAIARKSGKVPERARGPRRGPRQKAPRISMA